MLLVVAGVVVAMAAVVLVGVAPFLVLFVSQVCC